MTIKNNKIALLVLSCDKYADIWNPFYNFLFKYWNDCPFQIYHASNYKSFNHPKVINVLSNQLSDWSTETKTVLKQMKEDYVIIILEDYFIYQPVNMPLLFNALETMIERDALFLKLACFPLLYTVWNNYEVIEEKPYMGKLLLNQKYRINLQLGVWNKEILINLLKEGESPWEFEINASERTNELKNECLCIVEDPKKNYVHGPIVYLCTAVTKGVLMRDAINLCTKENINIDTSNRKIETRLEFAYRQLYTRTPISKRKYLNYIQKRLEFFK